MIRVGVDATSVAPEGKGISRVQRGTVRALAELGRYELVVFARHPEELAPVPAVRVRARPTIVWEQLGLPLAARRHRLDVVLTWSERLPLVGPGRYAVWLFEPPGHRIEQNRRTGAGVWQRGSDLLTLALWRRGLAGAAVVLTGSAATAEAIGEVAPAARVLYPGLERAFLDDAPGFPARADDPYVFHLGSNDPRDDTETAVEAARAAGTRLLVAGGWAGPAPAGVELLGRVSDAQLLELYRGAAAFLDTSLYEGFGYQVVEAMACGTPVVASDTTSIPELVGDAGLLCPPGEVAAFAAALGRVLGEPELAQRLGASGRRRARAFTWARTAAELAAALDEAAR